LQVSEAMVDLVVIPRQGTHPEFEEYRYPHAGTPNAVSDIQIVEFVPRLHDDVSRIPLLVYLAVCFRCALSTSTDLDRIYFFGGAIVGHCP
jgi:hypothetical protein